jgi:phage terminase large subunit-like protein
MPDPRLTLGMLELAAAEMVAERRAHDPEAWAAPLPALEHLDASWRLWTHDLFPRYVTHDFSAHQAQLWDWLWSLQPGTRPAPFIGIWPRGSAKSTSAELGTVALGCRGTRHYGLYVCSTQAQADDHVSTIGSLLESPRLARAYPDMASRLVGKYGHSQGWRRNRLRTRSRFTVDALGLDTAARGAKLEMTRPDFICFDDVDSSTDSLDTIQRKITLLSRDLLPAGSADCAVLGIQNLIHPDGLFARLIDGRAEFLQDRVISGPIPALEGLTYEPRDGRYVITGGQDVARCQALMDPIGLSAFRIECQHEATNQRGGMFDHLTYQHCDWEDLPRLVRVVIWCDPAVTATDDSDCYGIQADGVSEMGRVYRLWSWEDRTSPEDALERAIRKCGELQAESVGIETDQGGDTWQSVFSAAARNLGVTPPPFRSVKAGAGFGSKVHRANQMLSGYERGQVIHVRGTHDILERALNRFPKFKPFDLLDASVWSYLDLAGINDSGISF